MDINGTRFHLLTGEHEWEPLILQNDGYNIWWDRECSGVSLMRKVFRFPTPPGQHLLTPRERRGAASDRYGNIFRISEDEKEVRFLPAGTNTAGTYWSVKNLFDQCKRPDVKGEFYPYKEQAEPIRIQKLRGLTVTDHQYLIVGTMQPSGLLIFDLHAGGSPSWMLWPSAQASPSREFSPFDMAPAPKGGVWILDCDPEDFYARFWYLDRYFRVITTTDTSLLTQDVPIDDFKPCITDSDKHPECSIPARVSAEHGFQLPLVNPIAIEGLPDRTVLILGSSSDETFSVIHRYGYDHELNVIKKIKEKELSGSILEKILEVSKLKAHDFSFIPHETSEPDIVCGELTLVADNGNQAYVFRLDATPDHLNLALLRRYLPLRRFSGKALIPVNGIVHYDIGERWFPLTPQPRFRYESEGTIDIRGNILDGKEPDCVWHRLILDASIPDGASIEIESRAANEESLLSSMEWFPEPRPYKRDSDSEIPLHKPFTEGELQREGTGTWDLLFQKAKGRYLELRITLRGNGLRTPRIRAVRVYYPRFSYLHNYLPAVYRENEYSASFLDRFLANVEGFYSVIEGRIAKAEALFDIRTTPKSDSPNDDYLKWLGGWLGTILDPDWDEYRHRLFLTNAVLLYRWRGTQIGLRAAIRLAIDPCPDDSIFDELRDQREYQFGALGGRSVRIVERFLTRKFPGVVLGDPRELEGPTMLRVDDVFQSFKDTEEISQRYRDFLRRVYRRDTEEDILGRINDAWGSNYESFEKIEFKPERPTHPIESRDWLSFLRHEVNVNQPWSLNLGGYSLHVRFQEFLDRHYSNMYGVKEALDELNKNWGKSFDSFNQILFSPVKPGSPAIAEDWLRFTRQALGFTYAEVTSSDKAAYQEFISQRYRSMKKYENTYGLRKDPKRKEFADITLPDEDVFTESGQPLSDWIQFVSLTLPTQRNAHRFTVLIPTEPGESQESRKKREDRVKMIVNLEKPHHTVYDIKLYWALFQVGSARVGLDTTLGEGSRYESMVLGRNYLGQSFLSRAHPWNVIDRNVVGRDRLKEV